MRPLDLREFAEDMRRKGDIRNADLANEILTLIDIEAKVAEPYNTLCEDLNMHTPKELADKPEKQMEWLGDRSNLLTDIEAELAEDGRTGDTADQVKALLEMLINIRKIVGVPNTATDEDIENAIQALADRRAPPEYDI